MAVAEELGIDHEVVLYMKTPPDEAALRGIVAGLEDPVEDLVRKDSKFAQLGLNPDDYKGNPDAVAGLRAPIFEEKVVDQLLGQVSVTDVVVTKEVLMADDEEAEAPKAEKPKAKAKAKKAAAE